MRIQRAIPAPRVNRKWSARMHTLGCRWSFRVVVVTVAAALSACAGSSGEGERAADDAPAAVQGPASALANPAPARDNKVVAPDEQTLQHVRAALAEELPQFSTAETVDASSAQLGGDGITDDTATFRQLLAGGNRTVVVPAGDYRVDHLRIESNTVLILAPGVVIRDAGRLSAGEALVEIAANDVRIFGPGARIVGTSSRYDTATGTRAGIAVRGARNVLIEGLESSGHDGSGFLIGDAVGVPAADVVLLGCLASDNSRSGLVITSARRVRISDCELGSTGAGAQDWGIELERGAPGGVLDDIVVARARTRADSSGGIMINLPDIGWAAEPTTVAIVEHLSEQEPEALRTVLASEAPLNAHYSRMQAQTPRQAWQSLRGKAGTLVLSYYWPVVDGTQNFYSLTMTTPGAIDILPSAVHGSPDVRSYWTRRGRILLSRVYPFRVPRGEQELYDYFADAMGGGPGIAIDEVVAHRLDGAQRSELTNVLRRIRAAFPDELIVVWDASRWDDSSQDLLQALNETADAVVLETYISEREAHDSGLVRFTRSLKEVESRAPGIRSKVLLGIGAYDAMRQPDGDFDAHLRRQVQYLGQSPELCGTAGLGIYAPVYLSQAEQQRLDATIRTDFLTSSQRASCAVDNSE
jgi:hypothetical protein